ncbi:MAG: response regulator [Phycisphaerae bacterium]
MSTLAPPSLQSCKILLAEDDPRILEMLVQAIVQRFDAHLTCVGCGEDTLDTEVLEPHDIIITELFLPGMDGLTLCRHLVELNDRPIIIMAEQPGLSHAVEAMRLGVTDFFQKPFAISDLLDSMERALVRHRKRREQQKKHRRLRGLVKHVIRERRDLNKRMELICRDLVGAHRRLLHRVVESPQSEAID